MKRTRRWQTMTAIGATGALAFGLALYGAPPKGDSATRKVAQKAGAKLTAPVTPSSGAIRVIAGPGVVGHDELPIYAPVTVDYRKSDPSLGDSTPQLLSAWEPGGGVTKARTGAGAACMIGQQCAHCTVCVDYRCEGEIGVSKCVDDVLDGVTDDGCDDGLYCNGEELCSTGTCTGGTAPDCAATSQVCDEAQDACVDPCANDGDCDDHLECTDDSCDTGTGVCEHTNNCGPNSTCLEPFEGNPKTCIAGRCCDVNEACTRAIYTDCLAVPGNWLAVGGSATTCTDLVSRCPNYGSGIVADSTLTAVVGPISNLECDDLVRAGDDYEASIHDPGDPPNNFMQLELMRWVGGVYPGVSARWAIELRDENGILIENVFYPDGVNDGGDLGIRTLNFDPAITIPTKGIISFSVQGNFGLDGRIFVGTTDAVDAGSNTTGTMYVETSARAAQIRNYLGICDGGERAGLACDFTGAGNADCPDGEGFATCVDAPDIMSFELIGTQTTEPLGACCDSATSDCTQTLSWICDAAGDFFKGEGTLCGVCDIDSPNAGTPCDDNAQCDPGLCSPLPACETGACCYPDGSCLEWNDPVECVSPGVWQGFGTSCLPNCCAQPDNTGMDNCGLRTPELIVVPLLGDPAVQYTFTGDNSSATFDDFELVCMGGPNNGQPCNGDLDCGTCTAGNVGADCAEDVDCDVVPGDGVCNAGDCDQWCGGGIFDPDGTRKDPGWWHSFTLTACAEVRIDLCCSDVHGDALRPQWSNIYSACPCGAIIGQAGVDPPIGIGRGTDGWARGGPFCDDDNLWETFTLSQGVYYKPIFSAPTGTAAVPPGSDYQLHVTVAACPIAACCLGDTCVETDELDCAEQGGYWLINNVTCGDVDLQDCTVPGWLNPCCTGSCCLGPGQCEDQVQGQPLDAEDCAGLGGEFIGGATCAGQPSNFLPQPCPTCPIADEDNCLLQTGGYIYPSDGDIGSRRAEDFVAQGTSITEVCMDGAYTRSDVSCSGNWCDCSCDGGTADNIEDLDPCIPVVTDDFTVCVYADAGVSLVPGESSYPGTEIGCSSTTAVRTIDFGGGTFAIWNHSLTLTPPITGLAIGQVHWLEITNNTVDPLDNTCDWYWYQSDTTEPDGAGNGWAVLDINGVWTLSDGRATDHTLCLEDGMVQPPAASGACCVCDPLGTCVDGRTRFECQQLQGNWKPFETCTPVLCPQSRPAGDDCATDAQIISDGNTAFTNQCSTDDGSDVVNSCTINLGEPPGSSDFGGDVWYFYTATCSGRLTVSMCDDADYDAIMAIYSDGTDTCICPGTNGQPNSASDCGDDTCGFGGGPPEVETIVTAGNCYTIRIAGWEAGDGTISYGSGSFDVTCEPVDCALSTPPESDYSPTPADIGFGAKNRYMTFSTTTPPLPDHLQAVRVTFTSMPGYEYAEGRQMWVQAPEEPTTEASCCNGPTPSPTMWAATLGCSPSYADWSQYDRVDVYGGSVVPSAIYDVQFIDDSCLTTVEENYSAPLPVVMSKAGDIVGDCGPRPCTAPQGIVDFVDISAAVEKFRNLPASPRKARADVINSDILRPEPDRKIDFVDISCVVAAFRNDPCLPPGPPATDPCD